MSFDDVSPFALKLSEETQMRMLAAELVVVHPEIFITCKCNTNTRHMVRGGPDYKSVQRVKTEEDGGQNTKLSAG